MTTENRDQGNVKPSISGSLGLKIALIVLAGIWLLIVAASWAESAELETKTADPQRAPAAENAEQDSGDYNFNWLDPEKKIYVLQNRRYTKAGRVMLTLMGGPGLSNSYNTAWNLDPRISYYFSEAFGLEAFYTLTFNSQNNTYRQLVDTSPTTLPVIRQLKSEMGAMAQWVPWYAKINVFNKILYFDWYFSGGMGQVNTQINTQTNATQAPTYQNQNFFALYLGTGHLYHISDDVTVRIDFTGAYYKAPLEGTRGESTWFSNYNFAIGFGYRL